MWPLQHRTFVREVQSAVSEFILVYSLKASVQF